MSSLPIQSLKTAFLEKWQSLDLNTSLCNFKNSIFHPAVKLLLSVSWKWKAVLAFNLLCRSHSCIFINNTPSASALSFCSLGLLWPRSLRMPDCRISALSAGSPRHKSYLRVWSHPPREAKPNVPTLAFLSSFPLKTPNDSIAHPYWSRCFLGIILFWRTVLSSEVESVDSLLRIIGNGHPRTQEKNVIKGEGSQKSVNWPSNKHPCPGHIQGLG